MPVKKESSPQKYILTGLLTIIPLWLTWLVVKFLIGLILKITAPFLLWVSALLNPLFPEISKWLSQSIFQIFISIICIITGLYFLGLFTTQMIGKRMLAWFDGLMGRIPFIQTIYGSAKKLISALQMDPGETQRVVLIDFPSDEMKTVGFVTRTFTDNRTGRKIASVYVPTTPNPTSGYLEIVPVDKLTKTEWTVDEAITFIVSGGAVSPEKMQFDK